VSASQWQTALQTCLDKRGFNCTILLKNYTLHLALKGAKIPSQHEIIPQIIDCLNQYPPPGVTGLKIYAQTPDDPFPVWEYEGELGQSFQPPPAQPIPLWQRVKQGDMEAMTTILERALTHKNIQVKIKQINSIFHIELNAHQLPEQALLVKLIDQELRRYKMPSLTQIQVTAHDAHHTWETEFHLGQLPTHSSAVDKKTHSPKPASHTWLTLPLYSLDPTGKNILLVGAITGFLLCLTPWIRFILSYLVIIIHELGHTVAGWLMGYPSIPSFDFIYGGGITFQFSERWAFIPLVIYSGLGGLVYYFRRNRLTLITLVIVALLYTLIYFTRLSQLFVISMGHGLELLFIGIFLYRAITGWSCQQPGERSLYGILGFFILFYDLNFARQLLFDPVMRELYFMGKGDVLDHDFVRIAREFLRVNLSLVVALFGLSCLLTPLATWGLYRYQNYWRYAYVQLLRR
jgi:hypothetical protein